MIAALGSAAAVEYGKSGTGWYSADCVVGELIALDLMQIIESKKIAHHRLALPDRQAE